MSAWQNYVPCHNFTRHCSPNNLQFFLSWKHWFSSNLVNNYCSFKPENLPGWNLKYVEFQMLKFQVPTTKNLKLQWIKCFLLGCRSIRCVCVFFLPHTKWIYPEMSWDVLLKQLVSPGWIVFYQSHAHWKWNNQICSINSFLKL